MRTETYQYKGNNMQKTLQPFFSIIITTYNRSQMLKRALNSMLSQTEHDWEAIIVDDDSTDDTRRQVLPYICSNTQIKYFRKSHSGEALSKNSGIFSSTGKFISFLDSDDEYEPFHLQSRKEILQRDHSLQFLYGGTRIIGNPFVPDRFNNEKSIHLSKCAIGGAFFIERNVLTQLGGFRNILIGTDADLFDRIIEAGIVMKETNITSYIYHHENEDSVTNTLIRSNSEKDGIYTDINHL
jgi:glycosyltransferase involved in cell wall biosynthesis